MGSTFALEKLKELRAKAGLSQTELAAKVGVNQGVISNWETKKARPTESQRDKLREVLGSGAADEMSADASPIAAWLAKARIAKGLSVPELANRSGLTAPAIYRIEQGVTRNLQQKSRQKLEAILGIVPSEAVSEAERESNVEGLGSMEDFDPYSRDQRPAGAGIYVLYDISERPIYVGEGENVGKRIKDHEDKFWFKSPIVENASWIQVRDRSLRKQINLS